jgi:N6-adenosine-specific RNA methylase IME4
MLKYRTIVADPPWRYEPHVRGVTAAHGARSDHALPYDQMGIGQIAALPVRDIADDAAHLWLWTTNRYLRDALDLVEVWGFEYRQTLIWRKVGCPSPFAASVAPNHAEYLIFARRGDLPLLSRLKTNVVDAPQQREHSRKPEVFLDLIEQVSPAPRVELFARRHRLGWDVWGNESANTAQLPIAGYC